MNRNLNYVLFKTQDRSKDNLYNIPGGVTHVFQFNQSNNRTTVITGAALEVDPPVQALSLHLWLSRRPLDDILFSSINYLNPMRLTLKPKVIYVTDDKAPYIKGFALKAGETYYINVKNMQVAQNSYRLSLTTH